MLPARNITARSPITVKTWEAPIPLKLNSTGGGSVTVDVPSTASNYTATLPATTGTVVLSDGSNNVSVTNLTASGNVTAGGTVVMSSPFAMRNKIINGAMEIDQRNGGASITPTGNGTFSVDRWVTYFSQGSKFSIQQNAGGVTPPPGFSNYVGVTSTSSYSIASNEEFEVAQVIEGVNIADFAWGTAAAKSATLSFWVRSSLTGTFGGSVYNSGLSYCYPYTYSIPVANTWTFITVVIPPATSGTWLTTNGTGIGVIFSLGAGSTRIGTAGSWTTSNVVGATGQTNLVATNGATLYITGVQFEVGSVATPFERRNYQQELVMCQRYYTYGAYRIEGYNTASSKIKQNFYLTMRATPTVTTTSSGSGNVSSVSTDENSERNVMIYMILASQNNAFANGNWYASAEL